MNPEDLMREFVRITTVFVEEDACEHSKPCLSLDEYEYALAMLLLGYKDFMKIKTKFQFEKHNLLMRYKGAFTGRERCDRNHKILSCKTLIEQEVEIKKSEKYTADYLISVMLCINGELSNAGDSNRDYFKMCGEMALLTPYSFVTISINLLYSYVRSFISTSDRVMQYNLTDKFIRAISCIVDAARDEAIETNKRKYVDNCRICFPEDMDGVIYRYYERIREKFTGVEQLGSANSETQNEYLPYLDVISILIKKVEKIFLSHIDSTARGVLKEYSNILGWLNDSSPNNISHLSPQKWKNRFDEIRYEGDLLKVIEDYCDAHELVLVQQMIEA